MAITGVNNYNNYNSTYGSVNAGVTQEAAKAEETKDTDAAAKKSNSGNADNDYFNKLKKLVPSVEFKVGGTYASSKKGETLRIDPKLLEKMQNDPELEKKMKELIKGVESMTKLSQSINKATGWKTVYRNSYIDENGNYTHFALVVNEHGYKMSEKLREERRKNSEKLIEKTKEKAVKKKEELQKALEEKRTEKVEKAAEEEKTGKEDETVAQGGEKAGREDETMGRAEKLIREKVETSKDGKIYMEDADMWEIIEAMKEDNAEKADAKKPADGSALGVNVDQKI